MWNRLFKSKSSKENAGKKKKLSSLIKGSNSINDNNSTDSTKSSRVYDSKGIKYYYLIQFKCAGVNVVFFF